jgi:hypothetical protein
MTEVTTRCAASRRARRWWQQHGLRPGRVLGLGCEARGRNFGGLVASGAMGFGEMREGVEGLK